MYCLVCPFTKTFDEVGITYIVPDFLTEQLNLGQIVEFSLNKKNTYGIVLNISNEANINFDKKKLKKIISIKDKNIYLKGYRIELIKWIAKYYFTAIHNSFNLFLPKNLKEKIIKNKVVDLFSGDNSNYCYDNNLILSDNQLNTYNNIINSKNNKILLYGLTGSGKTEIYIKLIKDNLDNNKQSLFLIPEIILTNQLSEKIKKIFGKNVLIINSTITEATKTKNWININNNSAKIIIGTRSAVFYPFNNLGLIIIDEEHDNSYISDSSPRYNTIEVAEKITEVNGNKLILGSGTPSINSMYKAVNKQYELINLLTKYNKNSI